MTKAVMDNQKAIVMEKISAKSLIEKMLSSTDVTINGNNAWDITIHNDKIYQRIINDGALGLGESYVNKWWDCQRLDILFDKILRAKLDTEVKPPLYFKIKFLLSRIINFQSRKFSKVVAKKHYDLGNSLFEVMLDSRMNYSCGYWKQAKTLDDAQEAKLELICKKLQLQPGLRLLDIGCGWGGLAKYAAEKYGVSIVGITISQQQYDYAKKYCQGFPIEIRLQDYRDIKETFDRIVSVGMFEHVGHLNYRCFMETIHHALNSDGLFLLHTIGGNQTSLSPNEWISKYIFPNGMIPSIPQISKAAEKLFVMEDWQNFGAYYDNTLMAWYQNFIHHWENLKVKYDESFYRTWTYYLLSCAGSFRARANQLWQIVLSKNGIVGGYMSPR